MKFKNKVLTFLQADKSLAGTFTEVKDIKTDEEEELKEHNLLFTEN
jgi:hypothetical protein